MQDSDGTLTIGTRTDKSGFESDLDDMVDIAEQKGTESGNTFAKGFGKVSGKIKSILSKGFSSLGSVVNGVINSLGAILSVVTKLGLALGIAGVVAGVMAGAFMIVSKALEKILSDDSQLKTDLQYVIWAVQQALEPAVEFVANLMTKVIKLIISAIQYIAVFIKMITGKNIFANATAEAFKKSMEEANKNTKKTSKNLKEIKKQLAGFDEMNILQDTSSSGGGDVSTDVPMPSFNLGDIKDKEEKVTSFIDRIKQAIKDLEFYVKNVDIFTWFKSFGEWGLVIKGVCDYFYGLIEIIRGMVKIVQGVFDIIVGIVTGDTEKIKKGIEKLISGILDVINGFKDMTLGTLEILVGAIIGIIGTLVKGIIALAQWLWDTIKEKASEFWNKNKEKISKAVEWIKKNVIEKVVNFFNGLWQGIQQGVLGIGSFTKQNFTNLLNWIGDLAGKIVGKFKEIGTKVGDVVGNAFKGVMNTVFSKLESSLNTPIKAINGLVKEVNKISPIKLDKLSTIKFPRLAKGGIINTPGRGVMVGGAIAGERGAEGVIPLTDSQQMMLLGEAIGKYITINANITNTMNGRVISRELKKIDAENDFAFNK